MKRLLCLVMLLLIQGASARASEVAITFASYRSDNAAAGGLRLTSRPDQRWQKALEKNIGYAEGYVYLPGETVTINATAKDAVGQRFSLRLSGLLHGLQRTTEPVTLTEPSQVVTLTQPLPPAGGGGDGEVYRVDAVLGDQVVASKGFYAFKPGREMIDGDSFLPREGLTMYSGYVNTWDAGSVFGFGRPTTDDYTTFWGWRVQGNEDLDFTKNKTGSLDVLPNRPTGDWNWYWTYYANQQLGFGGKWGGWQWGEYNPFLHENLPPRESYPNGVFGYYAPNWYAGANTLINHYGTLPNGLYLREWMHPIWTSWAAAARKKDPGADLRLSGVDFWGEEVGAAAPQPSHMEGFLEYMQDEHGVTIHARTWADLCDRIRMDYGDAWATWSQSNLTMASQTITKAEVEEGLGQRKAVWWNQNTGPAIWFYTSGAGGSPYSSPMDLEEWGQDWARLVDFPSSDGGMTGGMPEGKGYRCWSAYEAFWKAAIPNSNRAWMWNSPGSYWKEKGVDSVEKLRRFFLQPAFTAVYDRRGRLAPVLNITPPHHSGAGWDHLMAYWEQRPPGDRALDVETIRRTWELTEALGPRGRLGPALVVSSRRASDDRAGTEFDTRKLGEFVSRLRDAGVGISTFVDAEWADQLPAGTPTVTAPRYDGKGALVVGAMDRSGNRKLFRYPGNSGDWQALAQAILACDPTLGFEGGVSGYGVVSQYGPLVFVENPDPMSKTGTIRCPLPTRADAATAVELFSCTLLKTEVRSGECRITVPMGPADGRLVLVVPRLP